MKEATYHALRRGDLALARLSPRRVPVAPDGFGVLHSRRREGQHGAVDGVPPLRCTICDCLLIQSGQPRDGRSIAAAEAGHYAEQHPLPGSRGRRRRPRIAPIASLTCVPEVEESGAVARPAL